jgi:hypothetical protein
VTIPAEEMLRVATEANILKIMGERQIRSLTIDYIPARGQIIVPRLDEDDDSLTAPRPTIYPLTYHLEDAVFGVVLYVALTCQGKVIVNPFPFDSWEHLATCGIVKR